MFAFNTVEELFTNSLPFSCQGQPRTAQGGKLWITTAQVTFLLVPHVPVALSLCLSCEVGMILLGKQSLDVWYRQMTQR